MLKSKKSWIVLTLISILVIVLIVVVLLFNSKSKFSDLDFKKEYERFNNVSTKDGKKYPRVSIPENNKIKYVTYNEILNVFNGNGDAVIYFGYAKCLYCRTAVQVLINTAMDTELEEIYYLDVKGKDNKYEELLNILGDEFIVTDKGSKEIYAPLVIFVDNGKIVSYNKGTLFSHDDPYEELDASQIKGLTQIYSYGIKDVFESKNK